VWTTDYDLSEQPNQAASEPPTPPPHVGGLAPTTHVIDAVGFPVTVTGVGFSATSKASLDGVELTTAYVSPTSLTATVAPANMPAAAGTKHLSVGTSNKLPLAFTATAARAAAPEPKAEPKQPEQRSGRTGGGKRY
jgi:hypothetical protein